MPQGGSILSPRVFILFTEGADRFLIKRLNRFGLVEWAAPFFAIWQIFAILQADSVIPEPDEENISAFRHGARPDPHAVVP